MADGMDEEAFEDIVTEIVPLAPGDPGSSSANPNASRSGFTRPNIITLEPEASRLRRQPENTQPTQGKPAEIVSFDRRELDLILRLYGFKVAAGEWRDYAIDMLRERAVFSVFRRTAEVPLYSIEKNPKLARKQGAWSVTGSDGRILKRGHDLATVLKVLEKRPKLRVV